MRQSVRTWLRLPLAYAFELDGSSAATASSTITIVDKPIFTFRCSSSIQRRGQGCAYCRISSSPYAESALSGRQARLLFPTSPGPRSWPRDPYCCRSPGASGPPSVGGQHTQPCCPARLSHRQTRSNAARRAVEPQQVVLGLQARGSEEVTDVIRGGETDRQEVGDRGQSQGLRSRSAPWQIRGSARRQPGSP